MKNYVKVLLIIGLIALFASNVAASDCKIYEDNIYGENTVSYEYYVNPDAIEFHMHLYWDNGKSTEIPLILKAISPTGKTYEGKIDAYLNDSFIHFYDDNITSGTWTIKITQTTNNAAHYYLKVTQLYKSDYRN